MSIISDALKKAQQRQGKSSVVKDLSGMLSRAAAEKSEGEDLSGVSPSKRPVLIARILLILLVVGSIALLLIFAQYLKNLKPADVSGKKTASSSPKETAGRTAEKSPAASRPSSASQVTRAKTSRVGYPTKPSSQEITDAAAQYGIYERPSDMPSLTGIMYTQTNPQAILGGEFVSEGSEVAGFKVKKILPDRVKVIYEEQEYEIRLR